MVGKTHHYRILVNWTGNQGSGTASYQGYSRSHRIEAPGKPVIEGSADPSFRGDGSRWNPEELLLASLSACHKLWFLGLCADAGINVLSYSDTAEGFMHEEPGGEGQFVSVTLSPTVVLAADTEISRALALHETAHEKCFIARSVNFPVTATPRLSLQSHSGRRDR